MFKNIIMVWIVLTLPLMGKASDLHLKLPENAYSVLAPKPNALTLKQVEESIVNDQLDIQISYERLLQTQKMIGQARAQYFPYGLGSVAALYFLRIVNPILLIDLVTSLPSKVYNVQSKKSMRMATLHSNEALAANIKNQVAGLYYTILKEESVLKLTKLQLKLLETLYSVTQERVLVGLSNEQELRSIELRLLDTRDICLKFSGYLAAEKAAFNTLISQDPIIASKIQLQTNGAFLNPADYGLSSEILMLQALDRSPEIMAADYMITAASKEKKSTSWSILSFSGIGFGYWGRVQVAGSKVQQARINRQLVETNLKNQIYVLNNSFHRTLDHFMSELDVFNDTAFYYEGMFARFNAQDIALDSLLETEIIYLKDFAEMVTAHYDSLIKLNDLERAILGEAKGTMVVNDDVVVNIDTLNRKKVKLSVASEKEIAQVEYVFDNSSLYPMTVNHPASDHAVVLKLSTRDGVTGHANVTFKNGQKITKQFQL